ncbi:MAG: hypothetical protein Kow0042_05200 [Calditrichia bacterium]
MVFRLILTGILFIVSVNGYAQWHQLLPEPTDSRQPLLQDTESNNFNFYDISRNIAALFEDEDRFSLWVGSHLNYESGDYRLPFAPNIANDQRYSLRLVKPLTENDLFKGYFGYHRSVDQAVLWVHQTRLRENNPFILADSSTGDFVLNGLFWAGEWAHRLQPNLQTGIGIYYNVDQRLKQTFPKPENNHRDVHFRVGVQYTWRDWGLGLSGCYFDEQEKVIITQYNLDQNLTPVLYKFRYSDLPVIFLGKTSEERQIDFAGIAVGGQLKRQIGDKFRVMGDFQYTTSEGKVRDGGSQPQPQGEFDGSQFTAQLLGDYRNSPNTEWRLSYTLVYRKRNAYHPEFGQKVMDHPGGEHTVLLSLMQKLARNIALSADAGYQYLWEQYQDYMTENFFEYRQNHFLIRLGANYQSGERWETAVWSAFTLVRNAEKEFSQNAYTDFFNQLFLYRIYYYLRNNLDVGGGLQVTYHYGPLFDVTLVSRYYREISNDHFKKSAYRQNYLLTFLIKFFIL